MSINNIALVAHDNRKHDITEWAKWNYPVLINNNLYCTGTTGRLIEEALNQKLIDENITEWSLPDGTVRDAVRVNRLKSGPLGGDQQLGAMISEGKIDIVIFFWDPMEPHPHDVDVKALLRIAVVYNVPIACNRSTADFLISSPLLRTHYHPIVNDFSGYVNRAVPGDRENIPANTPEMAAAS